MKDILFGVLVLILTTTSGAFIYFIAVNTVMYETILPNVSVADDTIVQNTINLDLGSGRQVLIPLNSFVYDNTQSDAKSYGKGSNFVDVITSAANLAEGVEIERKYEIDATKFIAQIPVQISSNNFMHFDEMGVVNNCESNAINIEINTDMLKNAVLNGDYSSGSQTVKINALLTNYFDSRIFDACQKYTNESSLLANGYLSLGVTPEVIKPVLKLKILSDNSCTWILEDTSAIQSALEAYKASSDYPPKEGRYEEIGGKIALMEPMKNGRSLNIQTTLANFVNWINSPNTAPEFVYEAISPKLANSQKQILDFTQTMGEGKTRIDLVRFGIQNPFVQIAENGLIEIQNSIVMPGETFSYLKEIAILPGTFYTAEGRYVGNGFCNSTTTLFRAVLESGYQITDRAYHARNVASFDWPYPMNIVDSAFYGIPGHEVDFKFKNDSNYPVLLKFEKSRPGDGYQYHTVKIFSSSSAIKREVKLYDWKKWAQYSSTHFQASFMREVKENGRLIRNEEFYSRYID